jgi:hypothetical protein
LHHGQQLHQEVASDAHPLFCWPLAHRAWNPPPSSSLAEEERLRSLLLRAAARDSPTLAALFVGRSRIALGIRRDSPTLAALC